MHCYYGLQITILPTNRMFSFCILRRIAIPASAFDDKVKFLEETRKSFGAGTFNISEDVLLRRHYFFVKDEYNEGKPSFFYAAECICLRQCRSDYWCLLKEVHLLCSIKCIRQQLSVESCTYQCLASVRACVGVDSDTTFTS